MRYADTSVLLAYLTPEVHSRAAEAFMPHAGDPIAISGWTEVELLSGLGLKLRTAQLNEAEALDALHLAIAAAHNASVYTLDRGMATAGSILGFPVILL